MRSFRHQRQSGFTLIELVIVIVIIGILSAVAIPKYADLANEAKLATVNAIAGSFSSAAATNFAVCSGMPNSTICKNGGVIACSSAGAAFVMDSVPSGVTYSGSTTACVVTKDSAASTAVVIKSL